MAAFIQIGQVGAPGKVHPGITYIGHRINGDIGPSGIRSRCRIPRLNGPITAHKFYYLVARRNSTSTIPAHQLHSVCAIDPGPNIAAVIPA